MRELDLNTLSLRCPAIDLWQREYFSEIDCPEDIPHWRDEQYEGLSIVKPRITAKGTIVANSIYD
jgi:hypothetical protein